MGMTRNHANYETQFATITERLLRHSGSKIHRDTCTITAYVKLEICHRTINTCIRNIG